MARAFLFYIILSFTSCLLFTGYGVKGKIKSDTWRLIDFKRYIAMSTILFFITLGFALCLHNGNILLPKQNSLLICGRAKVTPCANKQPIFSICQGVCSRFLLPTFISLFARGRAKVTPCAVKEPYKLRVLGFALPGA